ncbi:WD40 repeat domain-containing protein [Streptomyces sp. CA-288835]|uniref:WD40 repeat domain-containing protein n=1 Tax=Streptomyces sp. CA-288835 TaxID=3240069 RepID=UPI003D8DC61D
MATVHQGPPGRGSAQLWDVRTGDREATLVLDADPAPLEKQLNLTVSRPGAVGFSPTGRALAARAIKKRVIEVRDVATGRLRQSRALSAIDTAVFSPDGTRLAIVDIEGTVRIWHLSTGALHTVHTDHDRPVRAVAFAPDGRTLAVVHNEDRGGDQLTLLDATTGRTQHTIKTSAWSSLSLAFSPDGHTLATASGYSGLAKTWDARTGQLRDNLSVSTQVASLTFSPDGRTLATSSARGVQLWDLATSQIRTTLRTRSPGAVAFSPDGRTLAISTGNSVELRNVDLPDPARALRNICEAIDTTLTTLERSRYLHDQPTETGCQPR